VIALRRGFKTWCENAARGYRRELGLSPIERLDPRILAKHLRITIWTPAEIPGLGPKDVQHLTVTSRESWSAATLRNGDASLIIINNGHAETRQNNSLAHEIGHIVLRHEPAKMYVTPDGLMMMSEYNDAHEEEATWFAGAILVPRDALLGVVKRGLTDRDAADYFGVSVAVVQMRRNRTGVDIQLSRQRGTWAP
jgi:Zn-dependent peptidase ImmA (M78 family)